MTSDLRRALAAGAAPGPASALDQQGALVDVTSAYGYLSSLVGVADERPSPEFGTRAEPWVLRG
jgi:hypothetical protein